MKAVAVISISVVSIAAASSAIAVFRNHSALLNHAQQQTWRDRIEAIAKAGGSRDLRANMGSRRAFDYPKDYRFPSEYYNGFAYHVGGASGESYVIYRQGLSAPPLPKEYQGSQYEIAPKDIEIAVQSGQAIILSQSLSAGTFNSLDLPGGDSFFVFENKVCYLGACLTSTTLKIDHMKEILKSGSAIPAQL